MLESKDAAQLFTSQAIQKVADGDYSLLKNVAFDFLKVNNKNIKVADVFDLTFKKISNNYKNEYIYKNILANDVFLKKHSLSKATILFEFRVGKHKADCVIFNGHSTCYEIKTEFDNLKRLPEQLEEYSKLFDRVNVICSEVHLDNILRIAPEHVGIIKLTDGCKLKEVRKAKIINNIIQPHFLIQSLRRDEYVYIAERISNKPVIINNMEVYNYCSNIMEEIDTKKLKCLFRDAIKKFRKLDYTTLAVIPESLISSVISYKISSSQKTKLHKTMNDYIIKDKVCIYH
ncbi:sce7726 family protein [Enterobacter soli]|uniref:sce7726 family protein n=1 Tax=Enterobacter soli TaxID=885040 RepID=UPI001C25BF21|nr:sce7726 family protein [Enterobacter soli]